MKIGFYSPYLNSLAGGERYVLTLASDWSTACDVDVFWDDTEILGRAGARLNLDVSRLRTVKNVFASGGLFARFQATKKYDLIFVLSDGSIPLIWSKIGILHFQRPFIGVKGRSSISKFKLKKFQKVVVNSRFTKSYIDQEFGVNSLVIYPPAQTNLFKPGKKEKMILSVGRFSQATTNKKQKEILEIFRSISQKHKDWRLVLAGGMLEADKSYVDELRRTAGGWPVEILTNISFNELTNLYAKASIYWQSTGFGQKGIDPAAEEHFGIAVVEAMSAGCVPMVFNGGGLPEIISNGKDGYLWNTAAELIENTQKIISSSTTKNKIAKSATIKAKDFDESVFLNKFDGLLKVLSNEKIF